MPKGRVPQYPREIRTCKHCGEEFVMVLSPSMLKRRTGEFCSRACHFKAQNTPERNRKVSVDSRFKRSAALLAKFSSKEKKRKENDYVAIMLIDQVGKRHEHRVVAEHMLGRSLAKGEIVHHKNGIKSDNREENIVVLPNQSVHVKIHAILRKGGDINYAHFAVRPL